MSLQNIDNDGFAAWLSLNNRQHSTIRKHINVLRIVAGSLNVLDIEAVQAFLIDKKQLGWSNSYLNNAVNAIRLYAQYKVLDIRLQKLKGFKKIYRAKATLSDEEIEAILNLEPELVKRRQWRSGKEFYCAANPKNHHKWTIFFSIMAFTGMRPGEVAHLKKDDVDWGRGIFNIRTSKTNQPGIAPIPKNITEALKAYMANVDSEYLFPSSQDGKSGAYDDTPVVGSVDWQYNFTKRLKRLGIKRYNLTPYSFRHSYATRLLEENVSLFHVKKLMRHNDLKSTLVYEHLTTKDLIEANQRLPLVRRGSEPQVVLASIVEAVKSLHLNDDPRFEYLFQQTEDSVLLKVVIKAK